MPHSGRGIVKRGKQIAFNVVNFGRVFADAVKDVFNVELPQLHKPAFDYLGGEVLAANADCLARAAYGF